MTTKLTSVELQGGSLVDMSLPSTDDSTAIPNTAWVQSFLDQGLVSGNGWIKLGSLYIQWGSISMGGGGDNGVTFPIAFPTACLEVLCSTLDPSGGGAGDRITYVVDGTQTTVGVTLSNNGSGASASWLAIGH